MNIIELAKEAGIPCFAGMYVVTEPAELERFAALVRAEALEEAAKVCEQGTGDAVQTDVLKALWKERERIAEVIRGLKESS